MPVTATTMSAPLSLSAACAIAQPVAIDTAPGEGTAVRISLPRETVATPSAAVPELLPTPSEDAAGLTVLVVEDDPRVLAATVGALEDCIRRGAKGLLKDVSLFDIYRGPGVASGKKSVAFNLVLRADDRSLTGEEADEDVQSILAALKADHNAVLR